MTKNPLIHFRDGIFGQNTRREAPPIMSGLKKHFHSRSTEERTTNHNPPR